MGADRWVKSAAGLLMPNPQLAAPFRFMPCKECCDDECQACLNRIYPEEVAITVSGVVNGTCSECGLLNTTRVVPVSKECTVYIDIVVNPEVRHTILYAELPHDLPGGEGYNTGVAISYYPLLRKRRVSAHITYERPGGAVPCRNHWGTGQFVWEELEADEPLNCMDLSGVELTRTGAGILCDSASATGTLVAL